MSKRKYEYYQVATEYGAENYFEYRKALSAFRCSEGPATMYGIYEQNGFYVIMSKK